MGQIRTLLVLTAIGAWLGGAGIGGCGDIGASSRCETGRPPDDCPPETGDAGAGGDGTGADAGAARDASAPPPSETDAGPEDMAFGAREGDSLETPGASCFDGIDADEDGVTDCDDRSCGAHPYCCVGSTEAHCCTGPGRDLMLAFDMCTAGTAVTSCVEGVAGVGAGEATVVNGGFVANASSDTGIALDAAVNPRREYITLTATVETPPSAWGRCRLRARRGSRLTSPRSSGSHSPTSRSSSPARSSAGYRWNWA